MTFLETALAHRNDVRIHVAGLGPPTVAGDVAPVGVHGVQMVDVLDGIGKEAIRVVG